MRTMLHAVVLALLLAAGSPPLHAADWKPVDPAELALKAPKVQPEADAEAIFWEVRVADEFDVGMGAFTTVFDHYIRIKIFTERGREAHSTVNIPYLTGVDVSNVAARTIRPDGSIIELQKSDAYQRTILKAEGFKMKAVSFAVPGIVPGAIIEYRWRERYRDSLAHNLRLPLSRGIPVQAVRYYIRPLAVGALELTMRFLPFNAEPSPPQQQKDGYWMLSISNVPADNDEPYAPPPYERRPWMFVFYGPRTDVSVSEFWQRFSKELHEDYTKRSKPNDEIRRLAASAVAAARTDEEKLAALVRAVRDRIRRVDTDTADANDRRKAKDNKNAADAMKRGIGSADDVIVAFLAVASAAGVDARIAAAPDRADLFHKASNSHEYFVRNRLVAVRKAPGWTFLDPANEHSSTGSLRWNLELEEVLIGDPKELVTAWTPLSLPAQSAKQRSGVFTLSADGTLEGDCRIVYTGHWNAMVKEDDDQDTAEEREKEYLEVIRSRLPDAEISSLTLENVIEPGKNYTASFHVRVPGFAQQTGTRLIFQPAFFQKGFGAVFTGDRRVSQLYFPFPWTEQDDVTITLPEGFELEQPEAPPDLDTNVSRHVLTLGLTNARRRLVLQRRFEFGTNGSILFPVTTYPAMKQFFDLVHRRDAHSLILKRKETGQ